MKRNRLAWLLTVLLFSWPPMFASALWAKSFTAVMALNATAMLGAALGTWIHAWRTGESLATAGWRLPTTKSLFAIFAACAVAWWLPLAVKVALGGATIDLGEHAFATIALAVVYLVVAPIAGFGEELAWRGYLLPRLLPNGSRLALVIVGVVWGIWHGPLIVLGSMSHGGVLAGLGTLALTTALTIPLSAVFGWVWRRTGSLFAVACLHGWYDATRDIAAQLVKGGIGPLALVPGLIVLVGGAIILARGLRE